eukprot:gene9162-18982_t
MCSRYQPMICYVTVSVVALLCFLPIFLGEKIDISGYDSLDSVPLRNILQSIEFQYCCVAMIAATIPVMLDFMIDSFIYSNDRLNTAKSSMWLLMLASFIPNCFLFLYVIPSLKYQFLVPIIQSKCYVQVMSALLSMSAYGISPDDLCCSLNMTALLITVTIQWILVEIYGTQCSLNANESCEMAVETLNELLLFEKLEEDNITMDMTYVSVKAFIERKFEKFGKQAKQKEIQFNLIFSEVSNQNYSIAMISIDVEKFSLVMRTLILNAIDCTSTRGNIEVEVSAVIQGNNSIKKDQNNKRYKLVIRVVNDGMSLSEVSQSISTMEPSLNFTAGVLKAHDGKKGLGLWISHNIVKLHGGELFFSYNKEMNKTSATIEVPVVFDAGAEVEVQVEVESVNMEPVLFRRKVSPVSDKNNPIFPSSTSLFTENIHPPMSDSTVNNMGCTCNTYIHTKGNLLRSVKLFLRDILNYWHWPVNDYGIDQASEIEIESENVDFCIRSELGCLVKLRCTYCGNLTYPFVNTSKI